MAFWLFVPMAVLGWSGILLLMGSERWNILFSNLSTRRQLILGALITILASIGVVGAIVAYPG